MSVTTVIRRCAPVVFIALLFSAASVREASAQVFVSPFIGYNFSGDAGCPDIRDCEDKKINWGASFGAVGPIVGGELEFGYTDNFFGESSGQQSNVLTIMGNFMLAPKISIVQPFGLIGVGVIKTKVDDLLLASDNAESDVGWTIGGGLIVYVNKHVGLKGDVRYYKSFSALDLLNIDLGDLGDNGNKIDFGRAAFGVVLKF